MSESFDLMPKMLDQVAKGMPDIPTASNQEGVTLVGCDTFVVERVSSDMIAIRFGNGDDMLFSLGPYNILPGQTITVEGNDAMRIAAIIKVTMT